MSTPNRLKEIRLSKNQSIMQLTASCGVSSRTISGVERHGYEPAENTKQRLANALGVTVKDIWTAEPVESGQERGRGEREAPPTPGGNRP